CRDFGCAETSLDQQTDQRAISLSNSEFESINSSQHSLNFGVCETFPIELILVNSAQTPIGFLPYATSLDEQPSAQYESIHGVVTYVQIPADLAYRVPFRNTCAAEPCRSNLVANGLA